ncbi:hypothetical protein [Dactylosporangium sp. NPDC049140]|uniref:hypothetical protein n=1 Tax=Dactylosporangium sp. NPDC049140 TaxID=3155647 RepID=UPI0033CD3EF5
MAGHAIWSIAVPIALVEHLTTRRGPWLGRPGLVVTALVYLLGCRIIYTEIRDSEGFLASPAQRIGAAAAALALIGLAFLARGTFRPAWPAPRVWLAGILAFVAATVFFARPESWAGFAFGVAWLAAGSVWLARTRWSDRHVMALAAGALLTYAWGGFALTALLEPGDPVRWWGNAGFAAGAVALVVAGAVRSPRAAPSPAPASAGSSSG